MGDNGEYISHKVNAKATEWYDRIKSRGIISHVTDFFGSEYSVFSSSGVKDRPLAPTVISRANGNTM